MRSQEEIVREIVKVIKRRVPPRRWTRHIRDAIDRLQTPCDPRNIASKMRIMPRT